MRERITYAPLAHLPRSMVRQRSLQKGNSGSRAVTAFLQVGHFSLIFLRTMKFTGMVISGSPGASNPIYKVLTAADDAFLELDNFRHQVIVMCFDDLCPIKFSRLRNHSVRHVTYKNLAIDFGRVHGGASLQQ